MVASARLEKVVLGFGGTALSYASTRYVYVVDGERPTLLKLGVTDDPILIKGPVAHAASVPVQRSILYPPIPVAFGGGSVAAVHERLIWVVDAGFAVSPVGGFGGVVSGGGFTITEALATAFGAIAPEHVIVYAYVPGTEGGVTTSVCVPLVAGFAPDQLTDAEHDVAFATVHESVVELPAIMGFGAAFKETVGGTIECVQLSKRNPEYIVGPGSTGGSP